MRATAVHCVSRECTMDTGLFRPDAPTSNRRRLYCTKLLMRRGRSECSD